MNAEVCCTPPMSLEFCPVVDLRTGNDIDSGNNGNSRDGLSIDLVELPRLGLTFQAKLGKDGKTTKLYSIDHEGLFVSNEGRSCESTQTLLNGLPHTVVLEREDDGK